MTSDGNTRPMVGRGRKQKSQRGRGPGRLRHAKSSGLSPGASGKKYSADVPAGKVVEVSGPPALRDAMVAALRARGGEIDRLTHRMHTYPARLHPDAAKLLLEQLPGKTVLDPFCGGGTVLVEAMAAGRTTFGRDLNPVAVLVARARTRLFDQRAQKRVYDQGRKVVAAARAIVDGEEPIALPAAVEYVQDWFSPNALAELGALDAAIRAVPGLTGDILRVAHSSLVVKFSHRASDTSPRREERKVKRGAVLSAYEGRLQEMAKMHIALQQAVPPNVPPADVGWADARRLEVEADVICTSPPYPGTYDYLPQQHLRLSWLRTEDDREDLDDAVAREIGGRRAFRQSIAQGYGRWERATAEWMGAAARKLRRDGYLAIVIGDGVSGGRLLRTREPTERAARQGGLRRVGVCSIERVDPGIRAAKHEHILVFQKSAKRTRIVGRAEDA